MAEPVSARKDDQPLVDKQDTVSVEAIRDTLGRFVLRAGFGNERIVITYHGKPTAALVGLGDLERLRVLDVA